MSKRLWYGESYLNMSIYLDRNSGGSGSGSGSELTVIEANLDLGSPYTLHVPAPGSGTLVRIHASINGSALAANETITFSDFGGFSMGDMVFPSGSDDKDYQILEPTSNNWFGINQSAQVTTDGLGVAGNEAVILFEFEIDYFDPVVLNGLIYYDETNQDLRTVRLDEGEVDLNAGVPLATPFDMSSWTGVGAVDYSPTTGKVYVAGVVGGLQSELWELNPDGSGAQMIDSTASTGVSNHNVYVYERGGRINWYDGSRVYWVDFDGVPQGEVYLTNPVSPGNRRYAVDDTYFYVRENIGGADDPLERRELADGSIRVQLLGPPEEPTDAVISDIPGIVFSNDDAGFIWLSSDNHTVATTIIDNASEGIPLQSESMDGAKGTGFIWFATKAGVDRLYRIPETTNPNIASDGLTLLINLADSNGAIEEWCLVP